MEGGIENATDELSPSYVASDEHAGGGEGVEVCEADDKEGWCSRVNVFRTR